MERKIWTEVDDYIEACLLPAGPSLDGALARNHAEGLPAIDVSPAQGKLLNLLARMSGARNILEIGTLGGYSTIWLARAVPDGGKVLTLEREPHHAEVARANLEGAGLSHLVEVRLGPALDSLAALDADDAGPFDFIFIDADKPNNPRYLSWAMKLSRSGTVIVCDNVIREGAILDRHGGDADVNGVRAMLDLIGREKRLEGTVVQTVGVKGYDGFAIAVVG